MCFLKTGGAWSSESLLSPAAARTESLSWGGRQRTRCAQANALFEGRRDGLFLCLRSVPRVCVCVAAWTAPNPHTASSGLNGKREEGGERGEGEERRGGQSEERERE